MSKSELILLNKRAFFDYDIVDTYEAGMVLQGPEIKALRQKSVSIAEAWIKMKPNAGYLIGATILSNQTGQWQKYNPKRDRKLLLNKSEIKSLTIATYKGLTIIPVRLYFSERGYVKLEIATARGRKKFDKRQFIKDRDAKRLGS